MTKKVDNMLCIKRKIQKEKERYKEKGRYTTKKKDTKKKKIKRTIQRRVEYLLSQKDVYSTLKEGDWLHKEGGQ